MSRSINKKRLFSLATIVALSWCGPLSPMKKNAIKIIKVIDPCEKPPTGTTIKELPKDSLYEILQFFADRGGKETAELRCMKIFKPVIDNHDCYLSDINNVVCFLPFRLTRSSYDYYVWLDNQRKQKCFVDEIASAKGKLKNLKFMLCIKLNEKKSAKFLPSYVNNVFTSLKKNDNYLSCVQVDGKDKPWIITANISENRYKRDLMVKKECRQYVVYEGDQVEDLDFYKKDAISNEELNMCGDVLKKVHVTQSKNFGTSAIKWPGKFKKLELNGCMNFDLNYLKGLAHLKILTLEEMKNVDSNKLKSAGLKSLQSLSVKKCKVFDMKGLGALEALRSLVMDDYGSLVNCSAQELKNIKKLLFGQYEDKHSFNYFGNPEEKKISLALKAAESLKDLKKLELFDCSHFKKLLPKILESLKKIEKNGCLLKLPYNLDQKLMHGIDKNSEDSLGQITIFQS